MPEERRISPAVIIIPVGLGLGLAAAVGIAALAMAAPPTVYTCPHCGAEFDTEEELLAHIELEHPELPPPLANLYGVVTDAQPGAPLPNVSVQLWSPDGTELLLIATTDSSGYYSMADIALGSYLIRFEKEGYETVISDIVLVEGNNELNVQLVPLQAEFYMPPTMDMSIREHDILQWHYHEITWSLIITNRGGAPATHKIWWQRFWNGNLFGGTPSEVITLNPGETYNWSDKGDVDFSRCHSAICKLYGDWPENNYSEGKVIEGVPVS